MHIRQVTNLPIRGKPCRLEHLQPMVVCALAATAFPQRELAPSVALISLRVG